LARTASGYDHGGKGGFAPREKLSHTQGVRTIAFTILSSTRVKAIIDALIPRFTGKDQDHLLALADETAGAAYDEAFDLVQPLFDFRTDIQSTSGADMVGIADLGGYYTGTSVEDALQEIGADLATPSAVAWGGITGTLSSQLDLQAALDLKATLASPTFTGDPKAPTPLTADNDTSIATTAFVKAQGYATLASPTFTGDPKAPTPLTADNDTSVATTAFVKAQGYTTNTGTVTSVAVANATGITWTGSPVTTSGTLTPTLSTNLQAWSGLATSSKQDSSANLTAWSALATSTKQDSSANLTSWSAIAPATKADDSSVVHLTGNETITGTKTFNTQISSGAAVASALNDVTRHYTIHTAGYGINVTTNSLNLVAGTSGQIQFVVNAGATAAANITSAGVFNYGGLEVGYCDVPRVTGGIERGKMFATAAGLTLATGSAAGSTYSIYNNSAAAITLTQGAGLTLRLAGSATTGSRTLAARGIATVWYNSTTEAIVSGNVT
jgi:hypothetical protein